MFVNSVQAYHLRHAGTGVARNYSGVFKYLICGAQTTVKVGKDCVSLISAFFSI